jgi:hypothetical protein
MTRARAVFYALLGIMIAASGASQCAAEDPWLVFEGSAGAGLGKHIVLVSGDEEYRSEEALPQLAKILAKHHGFKCTVLFAIDPETGQIDPNRNDNIPGLRALRNADLLVLFTRFRNLPDDQMKEIVDYVESGRPIVAMRTSTHAFNLTSSPTFARYSWNNKEWEGGFGRQVLGETWISHHGEHGKQSTRGIVADAFKNHPIMRGIAENSIWGPTDVYGVRLPLPGDASTVILGQVLDGMNANDSAATGKQNDPMMPVAWTKTYTGTAGKPARVFATTMGASQDLLSPGVRRLLVNACYWALGLEPQISETSSVDLVGTYEPSPFKFNGARKGIRPADLK